MKQLVTSKGKYGPFSNVVIDLEHYNADDCIMPFVIYGSDGVVSEYNSSDFTPPKEPFNYENTWELIKAERDRRTHQGGYNFSGKWYHSDTFSRSQQLGLVIMGASIPQGLMWKTMDGSFVEMNQSIANGIFQSAALSDSAIFAFAESLNNQILNATDPESISIYTGWPLCYLDL